MSDKLHEMGAGAIAGFQEPLGREDEEVMIALPEHTEAALRAMVRSKLAEVIKKKDGKYVLYAPNPGRKKKPQRIGSFETHEAAKNAQDLRSAAGPKSSKKKGSSKKEAIDRVVESASRELLEQRILAEAVKKDVRRALTEASFEPENAGSEWDEFISKLGSRVLQGDKGFARRQKAISKASEIMVQTAVRQVAKALRGIGKVKDLGAKTGANGEAYTGISVEVDGSVIEPVMIGVENGRLQVAFGDGAKAALTKMTPEHARAIRGELASIQDASMGNEAISMAQQKRDRYLDRMEAQVDEMIASMSPLQISMLKHLLVKKYRKMS